MTDVYDVCVVGAGPAGLAASIQLAESGRRVALVESGFDGFSENAQELSDAEVNTPHSHSAMQDAVCRRLGGTSAVWGGRCVPLDAIDFEKRDFITHSGWPIPPADLEPFYPAACEFLGVGPPAFDVASCTGLRTNNVPLSDGFVDANGIRATQLERWSGYPHAWRRHRKEIIKSRSIELIAGFTCVGFSHEALGGSVKEGFLASTSPSVAGLRTVRAKVFVLACGGVESTRLILNSIADPQGLKLSAPNLVGRFYMGHPSGKIADIALDGDAMKTIYGFEKDHGVYVRRRITFEPSVLRDERLLNIAFWLDNPVLADPQHGSGVLSAAYLALASPVLGKWLAPAAIRNKILQATTSDARSHLINCVRDPVRAIAFSSRYAYQRYMAVPRIPGFFTYNRANRYALHFHSEKVPNWNSRIELADAVDRLGRTARTSLENSIREQSVDGYHQLGTLRAGKSPESGVTDGFGRLHGTNNVFVASSAVFPTSGQANPTLTLVAFAYRQSKHIDALLRS